MVKIVKKFNNGVTMVEKVLLVLMFSALIVLGILQVLLRSVFKAPLAWSEGMLTYLFIWSSFVGAAMGMNKMQHFCIDALVDLFPKIVRYLIEQMIYVLLVVISIFVVYYGTKLALAQRMILMPTIRATMMWPYLSLPFSFLLIGLHSISNFICGFERKEEEQ
ncbi:MAG: TRAP transporter small permease [Lachnospiraceae bacterium]|nr:TRAP transporter small permease [Lachnospiraceae bacterium]